MLFGGGMGKKQKDKAVDCDDAVNRVDANEAVASDVASDNSSDDDGDGSSQKHHPIVDEYIDQFHKNTEQMYDEMSDETRAMYRGLLDELNGYGERSEEDQRQYDIDMLGLKYGNTVDEAYEYLEMLFDEDRYGVRAFLNKHQEATSIEEFPRLRKYASDDPATNLAKMIEEVGECAEVITKELPVDKLAMELADVRHCIAMFERIVPYEMMRRAKLLVVARNYIRGYYDKDADKKGKKHGKR